MNIFMPTVKEKQIIGLIATLLIVVFLTSVFETKGSAPVLVWQKTYGDSDVGTASSMLKVEDGYIIVGSVSGNPWLVKTDLSGTKQWDKKLITSGSVKDMMRVSDGYILVGSISPQPYTTYMWLAKTNLDGTLLWEKSFGVRLNSIQWANRVVDAGDGIVIVGPYSSDYHMYTVDVTLLKTDYQGNQQWNKTYGLRGVNGYTSNFPVGLVKTTGGYSIAASTNMRQTPTVMTDLWFLQASLYGSSSLSINKTYPDSLSVFPQDLIFSNGEYVIAGYSGASSNYDFYIAKIDLSGIMIWHKTYGTAFEEKAVGIVEMKDGYALVGTARGGASSDIWVLKTSLSGNYVWNITIGDPSKDETASDIDLAQDGIAVTGKVGNDLLLATITEPTTLTATVSASSTLVKTGETVVLTASADGGLSPFSYQWYENSTPLTGKTSSSIDVIKGTAGQYTYFCEVEDAISQTISSNPIELTVQAQASSNSQSSNSQSVVTDEPTPTPKPSTPTPTPGPTATPTLTPTTTPSPTQSYPQTNESIFSNPNFLIMIAVITTATIFSLTAFLYLRKMNKQNPIPDILPSGWQFYTKPTTGEPPGTIFRITPDKKKFEVKQLDVKIFPCEESAGKFTKKASMGVLTRFNGLNNISINGRANKLEQIIFEMKEPSGETTYDENLDMVLNKWIESQKFKYRHEDRYFVIRNATKAKAINYQLTNDQVAILKEEASLSDKMLKQNTDLSSRQQAQFILLQEFEQPMRVMFNAEEIKMKFIDGKIRLSHHPVIGILDWRE